MARTTTKRTTKAARQAAEGMGGATALYIRVSTDKQATEGYSLDAQREKLGAYCKANGWTVDPLHIYKDEGLSGKSTERPAYQRMLEAVAAGDVRRIVAVKLDRLSRNTRDFLGLLDYCDAHACGIVSIAEAFDTGTAVGRAVVTVLMAFAELERSQIADRMQSGRDEKARQGERNGAPVPYGYKLTAGEWTVNADQAATVGRIFKEFNAGASLRGVAAVLNSEGIPAPKGAAWYPAQVRYILDNGLYAGIVQYNGAGVPTEDIPAIVDRATYDAAGERLKGLAPGNPTFGKKASSQSATQPAM
jgi:site-specific DNA recombinase